MQEATDILIVGAGPTGLTLALELAKHGASFRIVEKEPERHSTSRAIVVQPRTQELLDRHTDFREEMMAKSSAIRGVRWHLSKTRRTYGDLTDTGLVGTNFPSIVTFSQVEMEGFLESSLGKVTAPGGGGGRYVVERGVEATAIVQDPDGVTVTLSKAPSPGEDGSGASPALQTVRCRYVVGCDGAHSAVRKAATSIRYDGGTYQHDFILCDATLVGGSLKKGDIEVGLGDRFVLIMPLAAADGDVVRMACARDRGPGFERHVPPTLAEFQTLLDETYGDPGTLSDPTWLTAFRLHWRCASRYREGRLFVAGDAAHIHSPLGGQGMNTGIQDAINLAWKLAAATTTTTSAVADALLDTYDEERRPVGENLIRTTDRMFRLVTVRSPVVVWLRRLLLPWVRLVALCTRARRRRFFTFVSQFGVHYRASSSSSSGIVATACGFRGPVRGGDRLPDGPLVGWASASASAAAVEGGGRRDSGVARERDATTLQRLLGGTTHHLLLFSAAAAAAASPRDLALAAAEVAGARSDVVALAIFYGSDGDGGNDNGNGNDDDDDDDVFKTETPGRPIGSTFRDVGGSLHALYGFSKRPGYVLCRPDGYAAHVGHLSDLGELVSFLKASNMFVH
ncbi:hypothetical protein RB601_000055 [Gaeumannomyces tritici]